MVNWTARLLGFLWMSVCLLVFNSRQHWTRNSGTLTSNDRETTMVEAGMLIWQQWIELWTRSSSSRINLEGATLTILWRHRYYSRIPFSSWLNKMLRFAQVFSCHCEKHGLCIGDRAALGSKLAVESSSLILPRCGSTRPDRSTMTTKRPGRPYAAHLHTTQHQSGGQIYSLCIKNKFTLCCRRLISRYHGNIETINAPFKTRLKYRPIYIDIVFTSLAL